MKHERVQSVMNVAEVVDQSTTEDIQEFLQKECGANLEVFENSKRLIFVIAGHEY